MAPFPYLYYNTRSSTTIQKVGLCMLHNRDRQLWHVPIGATPFAGQKAFSVAVQVVRETEPRGFTWYPVVTDQLVVP